MIRAIAALVLATSPALAERHSVADLPAKSISVAPGKPPVVVEKNGERELDAPSCIVPGPTPEWLAGAGTSDFEMRYPRWQGTEPLGIERLVVTGATAYLERRHVRYGVFETEVVEARRIPLQPVARAGDLVVYAYRRGTDVYLVAPAGDAGSTVRSKPDSGEGMGVLRSSACSVALLRLQLEGSASQPGQITGSLPSKRGYRVDASLTKTRRDPKPLLSVVARLVD
jgi:hypothetical protein